MSECFIKSVKRTPTSIKFFFNEKWINLIEEWINNTQKDSRIFTGRSFYFVKEENKGFILKFNYENLSFCSNIDFFVYINALKIHSFSNINLIYEFIDLLLKRINICFEDAYEYYKEYLVKKGFEENDNI